MFDTFKEIWQTLCTNKLRTLLTGLSVAWGIFMLILLLSISQGVINSTMQWQNKSDQYTIMVWGGRTSLPYQGMKEGRTVSLRDRDVDAVADANSPTITGATAHYSFSSNISTPSDYLPSKSIIAAYPSEFNGMFSIVAGRFINEADLRGKRKVIILCLNNATQLFGSADAALNKTVNINGLAFTVVGVFKHDWEEAAYVPYTTGRAIQGYTDQVNSIIVNLDHSITSAEQSAAAADEVRQAIGRQEKFDPADQSAIGIFDRFEGYLRGLTANSILRTTMWVIGLLTLLTGIVGVSNIMFVSVRERTHEIGIRRALGAPPRRILTQIILESVVLTTFFGYLGIVLGTIVTEIVKNVFSGSNFLLNPSVNLSIAIEVTIVLIICGAIAGFFPARRALKVKPVEALREE